MITVRCGNAENSWDTAVTAEQIYQHFGVEGQLHNTDGSSPIQAGAVEVPGVYLLTPDHDQKEPSFEEENICRVCREGEAVENLYHPCKYADPTGLD